MFPFSVIGLPCMKMEKKMKSNIFVKLKKNSISKSRKPTFIQWVKAYYYLQDPHIVMVIENQLEPWVIFKRKKNPH